MLWASGGGGGGYPGVVSDGADGLLVGDVPDNAYTSLQGNGNIQTHGVSATSVSTSGVVLAGTELRAVKGVGLFGSFGPTAPTTGGSHTAGGTYTATEQAMLEACYTALQSIGLVT